MQYNWSAFDFIEDIANLVHNRNIPGNIMQTIENVIQAKVNGILKKKI